ncbi:MAG: type II secretion system F family protein [Candidatus Woesearchaeota archaeon]
MLKVKEIIKQMKQVLIEIELAKDNYKKVLSEIQKLDYKYQKGELDYKLYITLKNRILRDKSEIDVKEAYNNYVHSLKNKLYDLNSKALQLISIDESYNSLVIGKSVKKEPTLDLPSLDALEIAEVEVPIENIEIKKIEQDKIKFENKLSKKEEEKKEEIPVPLPEPLDIYKPPKPKKLSFFKRLIYAIEAKEKPWLEAHQKDVFLGGIFSIDFLNYLLFGKEKNVSLFGETQILPSILSYEQKSYDDITLSKREILDPYLLEKEIKELKSLISKKKPESYKANTLGYISNLTVRKISIYFIEKFPDFFKGLYMAVRKANLKILANTYINIMFFLTIFSFILSIPFFTYIFALQGDNGLLVILKTLGSSILLANIVFWLSFYYPFMKAKERKRSINTNMPFAIDHMSSVIASGVNPATMFRLISSSSEYGEVSVEFEKISNYVDFFGYDILTAIKAVALTTPSEQFKEFLDGFVSTIETGGDLKEYLKQKSSEALLNYRLERQKYVESLSTYSDIYTGVLIAAPLFFVTTLSLISVIGGSIAGIRIDTLIALGTYIVIPLLNVLFIIFLEFNQPEV